MRYGFLLIMPGMGKAVEDVEFSDTVHKIWVDGDIGKDNLAIFIRTKNVVYASLLCVSHRRTHAKEIWTEKSIMWYFSILNNYKQPKSPSVEKWLN